MGSDSRRDSGALLLPNDGKGPNGADSKQGQMKGNTEQMDKIKATQQQIDDATKQLQKNIEMIDERGERLDNLQLKSGESLFLWAGLEV